MTVRFLLDGEVIELTEVDPTATVLDHLRYRLRRTGTKEGCAEGDCGACTVLVGELVGEDLDPTPRHSRVGGNPSPALSADETEKVNAMSAASAAGAAPSFPSQGQEMDSRVGGNDEVSGGGKLVHWRAVNACILFLPMLHGKALMTVESLAQNGELNPLQACMAENGSSQCGFCTPGFVMALHGRAIGAIGCDLPVADVIAGNLCRCTGYGPIIEAGARAADLPQDDAALVPKLAAIAGAARGEYRGRKWFVPQDVAALADLLAEHPEARIVAGATDVGLWVTKGLRTLETVIFIGGIAELRAIAETPDGVTFGAAVTYAQAHSVLAELHPDLGELIRRFAGLQVRNAGTIGGNIANGSPIGDGPPALIALGATLTLRSAQGRRTIALEDYFLAYGKQDRRPGEFVESVFVPRPAPGAVIHLAKLSRRFDSDISAVCGAIALTLEHGTIVAARVAFGGMAGTVRRAPACEAALCGKPFAQGTLEQAAAALRTDFAPLDDVRGSAAYRLDVAANLLRRLWAREQGQAISVLELEAL